MFGNSSRAMNGYIEQALHYEHIWILTGPAGCGKTTVGQFLAKELSLPYVEGDDVRYCLKSTAKRGLIPLLVPLHFK